MRKLVALLIFFLLPVVVAAETHRADATLTLDGERFHHATARLDAAKDTDYEAVLFTDKYGKGKGKSTRLELHGTVDGRPLTFQLSFPMFGPGTMELTPNPERMNDPARWAMLIIPDKDTYGDGLSAKLVKMTVTITKYDAVGGRIEGEVRGDVDSGARSNSNVHVEGHFSAVRQKDVASY